MGIPATDNENKVIPRDLQLAAAEIAEVCRRHGLRSAKADLRSGESYEEMQLNWTQGRHGVERDTARLTYTKSVTVDVDELVSPAST
jgi:hypothetical protein